MAGTFSIAPFVIGILQGYSSGAASAGTYLTEFVAPCDCRIGGIQANAQVADTGSGSTVLDVLINDVSIWTTATDRPTLVAGSTGDFTTANVPGSRSVLRGTRVSLLVASTSVTGHSRVSLSVAIERSRQT